MRYDIRTRKSRFKAFQTLKEISRLRGEADWNVETGEAR